MPAPLRGSVKQTPRTFISMGLCHGHNPKVYGKGKYPYREAALRCVKLWHHFLPHVQVLVTLVHTSEPSTDLLEYKQQLEDAGAGVVLYQTLNTSCVTVSQVIRLLSPHLYSFIQDDDIIITGRRGRF